MNHVENSLLALEESVRKTAGARYNAARRLERRDWFATFSIAMFSAISVGIAVMQKVYALLPDSLIDDYLTALSIFIGIFVIVISLIEWGVNARLNAQLIWQNAEKLNAFKYRLTLWLAQAKDGIALTRAEVAPIYDEYETIKRSCPVNHETVDYEMYLIQTSANSGFAARDKLSKYNSMKVSMVYLESLLTGIRYFLIFWLIILILLTVAILQY